MKVKEIMKHPVFTVRQDDTIKTCGELMEEHNINGAPVVDNDRVVGFITRHDIFKAILPRYPDLYEDEKLLMSFEYIEERIHKVKKVKVRELMGSPAVTIDHETPLCKAGSILILRKIKQVPVMGNDQLVGIVTLSDICGNLMERAEPQGKAA